MQFLPPAGQVRNMKVSSAILAAALVIGMTAGELAMARGGGHGGHSGGSRSSGHVAGPRIGGGNFNRGFAAPSAPSSRGTFIAPPAAAPAIRGSFTGHRWPGDHRWSGFHSGPRVGVVIGAPLFAPWYPPLPYYYDPGYALAAPATTYIEQPQTGNAPAEQPSAAYWYFCPGSQTYYPYVTECPEGWQPVAPQPDLPAEQ